MIPMIDWLSVTVDLEDYNENMYSVLEKLDGLKQKAQELRSQGISEKTLVELYGQHFEVKPNGTASYAYILHNSFMELRFAQVRSRNKETYPIYIHFKSEFLWCNGPENCWFWFVDWLSGYFGKIKSNKINRVDLCCHTDLINELSPENFKGKFIEDDVKRTNRKITGVNFGSRRSQNVFARIYIKSIEIKKSKKLWFKDIWREKGLDVDRVTNVEFELQRNFFKNLRLNGNTKIESCEDFFNNVKPLWKYCTSKWLTMIEKPIKRIERANIHPTWKQIQSSFKGFAGDGLISRAIQKCWKKEVLIPSTFGYLTSYAAFNGQTDVNKAIKQLAEEGRKLTKQKGKEFDEIVIEKMKIMGMQNIRGVKTC